MAGRDNLSHREREPRRPNGTGSIFWHAKRQRFIGMLDVQEEGEPRKRRTFSGKTEGEVQRKMRTYQDERARGEAAERGTPLTVKTFLTHWVENVAPLKRRASTLAQYRSAVNAHLIPALGHHRLTRLKPEHLERYQTRMLEAGYDPATVQNHRVALSAALNHALRRGQVGTNIVKLVDRPRVPRKRPRAMPPAVARQVLAVFRDTWLEGIVELALRMGLRRAEILGLRWEDVHWQQALLRVWDTLQRIDGELVEDETKTQLSCRLLAMPTAVSMALERQYARQDPAHRHADGFVFTRPDGRACDPSQVSHEVARLLTEAGAPHETLRDLRHGYASHLFAAGAQLKDVSESMGHASVKTTADIYTGLLPASSRLLADLSDRAFAAPEPPLAGHLASSLAIRPIPPTHRKARMRPKLNSKRPAKPADPEPRT